MQDPALRQELYQWPSVAEAGRRALGLRYRLLTYMYYHFDRAAAAGAPVARPLWFEFPADAAARGADSQWLLGDSVLVSPVLEQARLLPSSMGFLGFRGIREGPESQVKDTSALCMPCVTALQRCLLTMAAGMSVGTFFQMHGVFFQASSSARFWGWLGTQEQNPVVGVY